MKSTLISIIVSVVIVLAAVFAAGGSKNSEGSAAVVGGRQIIEIDAKGGYSPAITIAKAGMPSVLKIKTRGTFDCSASLVIPDIGYKKILQPSGETAIEIPAQEKGKVLKGLCSMGMYNFQIKFN